MGKEVISNLQGISLIILFIIGDAIIVARGLEAGRDLWIAVILAVFGSVPLFWIYSRIQTWYPEKELFEINEVVFGKVLGKFVDILFLMFVFLSGASTIRVFSEFLITVGLPETPPIVFGICLTILCSFAAKEGIEVLGRLAELFAIIISIIVPLTISTEIPQMDISHIRPVLYNGWGPVFKSTLYNITFPFGQAVIFLMVSMGLRKKESYKKVYLRSLLLSGFILFLAAITELFVLGYNAYARIYFPPYSSVGLVNLGNFIQRLEIVVSTTTLLSGCIKIAICFLAASKGVQRLFNTSQYRFIVWPIGLLFLNLSVFIYRDTLQVIKWQREIWEYIAIPFEIILPMIIIIILEVKNRRKNQRSCRHE